ncbi:MAG: alanine:cation symporter family protein, partial [Oscillospiraceae bacterium]|nr:alanine:cation symporter family protein [Oscillospiraceae bacterium]
VIFASILPLFAFTTIIAWSYYGEKATEFCFQKLGSKGKHTAVTVFKVVYIVLIVASSVIESDLIWAISDTANGLMAIPNLIALVALNGLVAKLTKNYFARRKGEKVAPILSAYPELNEQFQKDIASGDGEMQ